MIFATLTPENALAQKCLASLVEAHPEPSTSLPAVRVNPAAEAAAARPSNRSTQSRYQLVLSFDQRGSGTDGSWVVGKLGPKNSGSINLPICSSRSRQIRGNDVCEILIHARSGVLMLRNTSKFHPIVYLQAERNTDIELQYRDKYVLHMTTNHLRIGPLDFVLDLAIQDETAYLARRNNYLQKWHSQWDPECVRQHSCLDVLPSRDHMHMRNLILHHTVAKGAFGVVTVGINKETGDLAACKTIHGTSSDRDMVNNEIAIASRIPAQTVGLVAVSAWWCEHGQSPPCFRSKLETVHLVMPYAPWSFATAAWHDMAMATRLALFRQVLEGVRNLHAAGIMHRDISPRNLLVFSLQPPAAALCDYGKAKVGTTGFLTALGPPGFTAPEVWGAQARREQQQGGGYTSAVDIFSLGLSLLATFGGGGRAWTEPIADHRRHLRALEHLARLQDRMPAGLGALLRTMLAWDPAERPTAEEALADEVWGEAAGAAAAAGPSSEGGETQSSGRGPSSAGTRRRQRSGGMSPSSGANKRARTSDGSGRQGRPVDSDSLLSPPPA